MRFAIRHSARYSYSCPVRLGPQQLRLYPRSDGALRVLDYRLEITPPPAGRNDHIDLEGNRLTQLWFDHTTDALAVEVTMTVDTFRHNPYNFILNPAATALPLNYPREAQLAEPFLQPLEDDPAVAAFAARISAAAGEQTLPFLNRLVDVLFQEFVCDSQMVLQALNGPAHTLRTRQGSRFAITALFVECCRMRGIVSRFASGYRRTNGTQPEHYLHIWPEVYLPEAGWRGFDPALGGAVSDTHVTVAASAIPHNILPLSGVFYGDGASSQLHQSIDVHVENAESTLLV